MSNVLKQQSGGADKLPRAIFFDLDDTIVTFGAVSREAWRHVCDTLSENNTRFDGDLFLRTVHEVSRWFWSDPERHKQGRRDLLNTRFTIIAEAFNRLCITDKSLCQEVADAYSQERDRRMAFFPGAEQTLEHLKGTETKLALLTNGQADLQRQKVERFGLERFFPTILIEGELGFGKPEEAVYRMGLQALGVKASEVWMVGDNLEWDVAAPQKLGIFGIWHDYRGKGLSGSQYRPDRTIHAISELTATRAGETQ